MEIKIKWIKRKQMTHENTYRDDIVLCFVLMYKLLKMYKDKEIQKNVKNIFLSMCDVKKVFDIYIQC